jgi:hypothetical protein
MHSRRLPRACARRDLKSGNLLLEQPPPRRAQADIEPMPMVKITDFGISREKEQEQTIGGGTQTAGKMTGCGTVMWMAPEILQGKSYNESVDVYSFSMCMVELLDCNLPVRPAPPRPPPQQRRHRRRVGRSVGRSARPVTGDRRDRRPEPLPGVLSCGACVHALWPALLTCVRAVVLVLRGRGGGAVQGDEAGAAGEAAEGLRDAAAAARTAGEALLEARAVRAPLLRRDQGRARAPAQRHGIAARVTQHLGRR